MLVIHNASQSKTEASSSDADLTEPEGLPRADPKGSCDTDISTENALNALSRYFLRRFFKIAGNALRLRIIISITLSAYQCVGVQNPINNSESSKAANMFSKFESKSLVFFLFFSCSIRFFPILTPSPSCHTIALGIVRPKRNKSFPQRKGYIILRSDRYLSTEE